MHCWGNQVMKINDCAKREREGERVKMTHC